MFYPYLCFVCLYIDTLLSCFLFSLNNLCHNSSPRGRMDLPIPVAGSGMARDSPARSAFAGAWVRARFFPRGHSAAADAGSSPSTHEHAKLTGRSESRHRPRRPRANAAARQGAVPSELASAAPSTSCEMLGSETRSHPTGAPGQSWGGLPPGAASSAAHPDPRPPVGVGVGELGHT